MTTAYILKEYLRSIAENDFSPRENTDLYPVALEMMDHIGSPDSELRDNLIYSTFNNWISKKKLFTGEQLRQLLHISLDDQHLFYLIGEAGTDSVFTRSFSVLLLPLVLINHRGNPFLSKAEISIIKNRLIEYINAEMDVRGFVSGKGWAHAVAHSGDALDDLAQCGEMDAADLLEIIDCISGKMSFDDSPYIHDEDERMVTAVVSVMQRQLLDDEKIGEWIRELVMLAKEKRPFSTSFRQRNIRQFLRSLYFRLYSKDSVSKTSQVLADALVEINRYRN